MKIKKLRLGALLSASTLVIAAPVMAQEPATDEDTVDEIVVQGSGYARALRNALAEKRKAPNIIEAVSTEDIGKLPEISIAESLARLPGLAANRDRGNSTEISIRGLGPNLSNTLLNGREIVSGEASRNVRYEQYPGELLTGAFVYKSPIAAQVEGGIGGTVDLRTIKPLAYDNRRIIVNARGSYFGIASNIEDADPLGYTLSISFVDQFFDDTLGFAVGYARRVQPIATARTNIFPYTNSFADLDGDGVTFGDFGGDAIPFGYEALIRGGKDVRDGVVSAIQWEPTENFALNLDFFYSTFDFQEEQRGFRAQSLAFGNDFSGVTGVSGFVTGATTTNNANFGLTVATVNEEFVFVDDLYAGGVNAAWELGRLTVNADVGYSYTTREAQFSSVQTQVHDVSGPSPFVVTSGLAGTFGSQNGVGQFAFNVDLTDPLINLPATVQVPTADTITDELVSAKLDFKYEVGGFLTSFDFGARYSSRGKDLVARTDFPFIDPANRTPIPANLLGAPLVGFGAFANLPPVLTYDREAVIDQVFGGIDPQTSNFDQTESWDVEEDIWAGYAQANFEAQDFFLPFSGNIGVRVVNTQITSSSTALQNGVETGFVEVLTPFTLQNEFTDVLPSLNLAFFLTDKQIIRLALAKAIARPPLDDLRAGVGEFNFGNVEAFGGNPLLEPFRTNQIDLTYEWYFSDDSAFSVSGFYKDVETFIVRATQLDVTLPSGLIGDFTQPINGTGGNIKGIEASYQQPLTFLPGILDGLGVYANYTYIDSNIAVDPAFVTGSFPLPGLSPHNVNAQLWYYKAGFEWRVGYRFRSAYATELGDVPDQVLFNDSEAVVDFQTSYTFPEGSALQGVQLLFQANNLTDEPFQTYYGNQAARGRYEEFGRRFWWGASYEF